MLPSCAEYSRQLNEPLIGTIGQARAYFLLEYSAPFGNKALPESTIPPTVFQHFARIPLSNCVLIRQPESRADSDGRITFFAVNVATAQIYEFNVAQYEDLLALDLQQVLDGQVVAPRTTPLYTICTNGKRDVCCSSYGVAFYNVLREQVGEDVWQTSHIGGHRFAATGIMFPSGLCYGYLDPQDVPQLVEHVQKGRVWLEKLRGHILHAEAIQAADYFLRREVGAIQLGDLQHLGAEQHADQWLAHFRHADRTYTVIVTEGALLDVLASTGDTQFKPTHPFQLVSITAS